MSRKTKHSKLNVEISFYNYIYFLTPITIIKKKVVNGDVEFGNIWDGRIMVLKISF